MDIGVDERTCLNIKESLKLEWLDANGEGGYASSTILNCHTRRYHGLLVCSLMIPPGRYVLLSKFEESILVKDKEFFLSFHKYPGIFSPLGYKYLKHFQANPCPALYLPDWKHGYSKNYNDRVRRELRPCEISL